MTTKETLQGLTKRQELEQAAMPIWQLRAVRMGVIRTCINCENFNIDGGELCTLWRSRPPAKVIVYGCDKWQEEIPF